MTIFSSPVTEENRIYIFSVILVLFGLFMTLQLGLLAALLGGLLIYQLVEFGSRILGRVGLIPYTGKIILLLFVALVTITALAVGLIVFTNQITEGPESFVIVMQRMADVVDAGRDYLPQWILVYLPSNIDEWQVTASNWLRDNARDLSLIGQDIGKFIIHLIIGMVIGGMVALGSGSTKKIGPLAESLVGRISLLDDAFTRIVFSQVRISLLNTFLTGIFLALVMPAMGIDLPLTKTMIVITFLAGLLPIVGNLISNTVIVLISLSVSPIAAVSSLVFLVAIHKLEYFVNARIIGTRIRAHAWELLIVMLFMEAAFGIPGLVAAPIFYAYIKDELTYKKLI
jgi:predicted PurR-regulated permease PerM